MLKLKVQYQKATSLNMLHGVIRSFKLTLLRDIRLKEETQSVKLINYVYASC